MFPYKHLVTVKYEERLKSDSKLYGEVETEETKVGVGGHRKGRKLMAVST